MQGVDWALVQAFLSVAECGSLSAAARQLGTSQPTLGRQIKAIEQQLGTSLFVRQHRGLLLTDTGQRMVPAARRMRDAVNEISLTVAGQQQQLKGTVRITASEIVSSVYLPPILAHIRSEEPQIELELVPSDLTENLLFREADIAIRMYRPTQLDLITRHIGEIAIGIFAAKSYWVKHGYPTNIADFANHQFVGYDRNEQIIHGLRAAGIDADRHFFGTRCDNQIVYWELVRHGCGIGFSHKNQMNNDPLVEELLLPVRIDPLPVWLTAHQAMRATPRIRRVWDMLHEGLALLISGEITNNAQ